MTDRDIPAFASLLKALAETFDVTVSEGRAEMYAMVLRPYPIEAIQAAVHTGLSRWKFFPRPAEIVEILAPAPDLDLRAAAALEVAMDHNFHDRRYRFEDPAIHRTIELMGGWEAFCHAVRDLRERDWTFYRRDWMKTYVQVSQSGDVTPSRPALGQAVACPYLAPAPERKRLTG